MLRDPVERLFSQYRMSYSQGDTDLGPEEFFETNNEAFSRGLYSVQLERFFSRFDKENVLILFYEEVFRDPSATAGALLQVGGFLGVDNRKWEQESAARLEGNLGSAGRPRAFGLYRMAKGFRKWCMDHDLEGMVRVAKKLGIKSTSFGGLHDIAKPNQEIKEKAWSYYQEEVQALESLLGRSIPFWGPENWQS